MKFYGITDKFLTQEEKDMISLKYAELKNDPTKSMRERNQVLVEGYWMALERMNKIQKIKDSIPPPPSRSTFKIEWLSESDKAEEDEKLYRWVLVKQKPEINENSNNRI